MLTLFSRQYRFFETPPDGGGNPPPDPPPGPKMVPEADLMAVKAKAERDVNNLKQQLDTIQREGSATKAQLEVLNAELTQARTTLTEVDQLRSQAADAVKDRDNLQAKVVGVLRTELVDKYGYKAEDIKDYKLEQLELLTEALAKNPSAAAPRRFNSGGNGSGAGTLPATGRGKILQAFEAGEVQRVRRQGQE